MSDADLRDWWVHPIHVETVSTVDYAASYAAPVERNVWLEEAHGIFDSAAGRDDATGAKGRALTLLMDALDAADLYPPDSVVTFADGRRGVVTALRRVDSGSLNLGSDHVEVYLGPTLPGFYQPSAD